jgi:hypothetical protein
MKLLTWPRLLLVWGLGFAAFHAVAAGTPQAAPSTGDARSRDADQSPEKSALAKESADEADRRRNEVRAYPLGKVKSVRALGSRFFDANGKVCPTGPTHKLKPRTVRHFLANAVAVSQISLMNYYGVFGECFSQDVQVVFVDGRLVHLSFGSESETAYLSPVVDGRETDVYFYYCDKCSE